MVEELIKQLLEAGVHFGHQTQRWNPKMKRFIFGQRAGIYIIDLEKTADQLNSACDFVKDVAAKGGKVLFVGTKKQAQSIVEDEAKKASMYFVSNRWLGGLLTNFQTVRCSIDRLNKIDKMGVDGTFDSLTKKEVSGLNKEKTKLIRDIGGIREMGKLPDVLFIVDPRREEIAVKEANKLGIPIIAIVDTNCDPEVVEHPVPGNDDALKSIRFLTSKISESIHAGRKEFFTSEAVKEEAAKAPAQKDAQPAAAAPAPKAVPEKAPEQAPVKAEAPAPKPVPEKAPEEAPAKVEAPAEEKAPEKADTPADETPKSE